MADEQKPITKRDHPEAEASDIKIDDDLPATKKLRMTPAPPVQQQGEVKSPHVFYPSRYKDFDPANIVFAKDPTEAQKGGGHMLYISYRFEDGIKPLMIQTPNAMYSPTGIKVWDEGKASILLSAGREWQQNTLMVEFRATMDAIQKRCIEIVAEKGMNLNGSQDPQIIQESFSDLMGAGCNTTTGEEYPPSINAAVIINGKDPVELFEKVSDSPVVFNCMIPSDVKHGCGITAILHFRWVFRKKAKKGKGWDFSIHTDLYQARVFPPTTSAFSAPRGVGCAVSDA